MEDIQSSINPIPSPPPPLHKDNLPMLYYGLILIGTATAFLALYNLIIIRLCTTSHRLSESNQPSISSSSNSTPHDSNMLCTNLNMGFSFKYKKDLESSRVEQKYDECSVCLSGFEDGEDVSELPKCRHSFHAECIRMWLYSHFDCPLCRQRVEFVASCHNVV